jgi:asparagine synthase (glutamine-hydrolysing)
LDPGAAVEYLTLGYVVSPRTVLREARKVRAGHLLRVGPSGIESEHRWYSPRFQAGGTSTRVSWAERVHTFDALFRRACARCTVSDVPVALLLSDGIDSNAVRVALAGHRPAVRSFTFRPREAEFGTPPARLGGDAGEIIDIDGTASGCLDHMDGLFAALTEPVGDFAALATWMLIRAARDRATVFLCGHGGDEILAGYHLSQDRFRLAALRRLAALPEAWVRAPLERFLYGDEPLAHRRAALRAAPPQGAPAAARYLIHRPLLPGQVRAIFGDSRVASEPYLGTVRRLYADCATGSGDLDCMQEVMIRTFLSENILSFADSVAMDSSAELRMPFLDRDLAAFVLSLPPRQRVGLWPGRTNTKLVLRRWAATRLPREVVRRRKRPFQAGDASALLRRDRAGMERRVLESPAVRRTLPGLEAWLREVWDNPCSRSSGALWNILTLSSWCTARGIN